MTLDLIPAGFLRRACAILISAVVTSVAFAGATSENVIVVVNADSADSRTVANHYVALRNVPSTNVVFLSDVPTGLKCSLEDFKTKILGPLLEQVNQRGLARQVQVIAYSVGFPTSVDVSEHKAKLTDPTLKRYQRPIGSLTGLTHLFRFVLSDNEAYFGLASNLYARARFERHFSNPFLKEDEVTEFDEAERAWQDKKYADAADRFEKLANRVPAHAPFWIRLAQCQTAANNSQATAPTDPIPTVAIQSLAKAVAAGWQSGRYIRDDEQLSQLMQRKAVKTLVDGLTDLPTVTQLPVAFSTQTVWSRAGWPAADEESGLGYLPSCMLGVIHPRGSTVDEVIDVLERAAKVDETFPEGTFVFSQTADVRTKTRQPEFINGLLLLGSLDKDAQIVRNKFPKPGMTCVGVMFGSAGLPMASRQWKFAEGAIADNLTSLSAAFGSRAQTKITEFLHAGAVMTCGPVAEPYTLPTKFPSPVMYGYYAMGATAIETFYSSIGSPYQTLIVGDPLAAPFRQAPTDRVGVRGNQTQSFLVGWKPQMVSRPEQQAASLELFVEGKLAQAGPPKNRSQINLRGAPAGALDTRIVLVGKSPLQPRTSSQAWVTIGNPPHLPTVTRNGDVATTTCEGAESIELFHHAQSLGKIEGNTGTITLDKTQLGSGPLRLRPIATVNGQPVQGKAVELE